MPIAPNQIQILNLPPTLQSRVKCFNCHAEQADRGMGKTCIYCGMSPLPSRSYDTSCVFHPERKKT